MNFVHGARRHHERQSIDAVQGNAARRARIALWIVDGVRRSPQNRSMKSPATAMEEPFTHDAFISYSRRDKAFGELLEKALEKYRPPEDLPVPQRQLRIFRDEEDFIGTEYHLPLSRHLNGSKKLLVVCSPHARRSVYVNDEIRRFVTQSAELVVPLLLAGRAAVGNHRGVTRDLCGKPTLESVEFGWPVAAA